MSRVGLPISHVAACLSLCLVVCVVFVVVVVPASSVSMTKNERECPGELKNANKSITAWGESMASMVNESELSPKVRETVHKEANEILDLIEDFSEQLAKQQPPQQLVRLLVTIRRRANRMAFDVYLNTFDMRWTYNSLEIGVLVERVQEACLDRKSIAALESPDSPLDPLVYNGA